MDLDDPDNDYYVELLAGDLFCRLTKVVGEAIRVRCNSLSSAALLERTVSVYSITMSLYDVNLYSHKELRMAHVTRGWRFIGTCRGQHPNRELGPLSADNAPRLVTPSLMVVSKTLRSIISRLGNHEV